MYCVHLHEHNTSIKSINKLKIEAGKQDWKGILDIQNSDSATDCFVNIVSRVINKSKIEKIYVMNIKPWINKGLIKCCNKRKNYLIKKLKTLYEMNISKTLKKLIQRQEIHMKLKK